MEPKAVEAARRALLDATNTADAQRLLGAVCDLTRLNIVRALSATPLVASDVALVVGKTRSATSQHLRVLREIGAVASERHGNVVRYRLGETPAAKALAEVSRAFDRLAA